ncbi:hypothetical protein [Paraburkholderia tropica]|nr:hypothetical protein [Paraburkholderia tropica]
MFSPVEASQGYKPTYVPVEIGPLTGALNALLGRLKTALDH